MKELISITLSYNSRKLIAVIITLKNNPNENRKPIITFYKRKLIIIMPHDK